jgi:hypothetical protein
MGYCNEKLQKLDPEHVEAYLHIRDVWCQKFSERARLMIDRERLRRDAEHESRKLEWWQDQLLKHLCWTRSDIRIQFAQRHYLQTPCTSNERNARRHYPPDGLEDGLRLEWRDEKRRLKQDTKVLFLVIDTIQASSDGSLAEDLRGGEWPVGDLDSLEALLRINSRGWFLVSPISGMTAPESTNSIHTNNTDSKSNTDFVTVDSKSAGDVESKAPTMPTETDDGPWAGAQFASTVSSLIY